MLKKLVPIFFLAIILVACNQPEEEEFIFPEAEFSISPESATINEPMTFQVKITAGEKPVEDADVKFEFWQEGQEDSEHLLIPVEHQKNGIYKLEKSFDTAGTYFVYYHADAMSLHMMEKSEFIVND